MLVQLFSYRRKIKKISKFQFVEQNIVECPCDFCANLVQHFIGRYSRYPRCRTKSHDICSFSRYQTALKTLLRRVFVLTVHEEISLYLSIKSSAICGAFVFPLTFTHLSRAGFSMRFGHEIDIVLDRFIRRVRGGCRERFTSKEFYGIIGLI